MRLKESKRQHYKESYGNKDMAKLIKTLTCNLNKLENYFSRIYYLQFFDKEIKRSYGFLKFIASCT
jgi:hypothetical protein